MFFSIVIPTYNRNEFLSKCLSNLDFKKQNLDLIDYEVIVTDDNIDGTTVNFNKSKFQWVKWVKGKSKGPAANRNNGAKHASGEWLIFIDDDCLPDKNLLNEYLRGIKNEPDCLAFEGAILPDDEKLLRKDMAECPVNTNGGCFWSANICVQKKLFESIGGFNEQFLIAAQEDQQLKIDIERATGKKIVFLKTAQVTHPVRFISFNKKLLQIPAASKNFSFFAFKNKQSLGYTSIFKFFSSQALVHLKNIFAAFKNFQLRRLFIAIVWLCFGVPLNVYNFWYFKKCSRRES